MPFIFYKQKSLNFFKLHRYVVGRVERIDPTNLQTGELIMKYAQRPQMAPSLGEGYSHVICPYVWTTLARPKGYLYI